MIAIIGGTSGIGLQTALYLNSKGKNVIIGGRKPNREINYSYIDVTKEETVKKFFESLPSLNGLVYAAGITTKQKAVTNFDKCDFEKILDVNVTGALLCLKYAYPLLSNTKGKIVIVNSIAARTYSLFSGVEYTISKSALSGLVKQLAIEFAKDGVLINSIFPSMTATPMLVKNVEKKQLDKIEDAIPLKRIAKPIEVAKAIEFLISEENTYITGSGIDLNGGQYLNG
jgi:NAD(P)-dependent dehydrogenase (short-subunit alcohol dehydrogenase family)